MATTLLDTTNFPIYAINILSEDHFVVAGGGGASKTGIPNAFAFYRICKDGKKLKAVKIHQHEAHKQAIMNMDVNLKHKTFAAGMDNFCRLYRFSIEDKKRKESIESKVTVKESACQETAVGGDDDDAEYQKCVRFSLDGDLIATASSEGQVKILKHPDLSVVHDIKAHKTDIDEIDFHPNSKKFVTVSRDGTAYLWNTDSGKRDIQLHFSAGHEDENIFRFRNCKFSLNMDKKESYLYTTHVQAKFTKNSPKLPNYLVSWDMKKCIPKMYVAIKKHVITQLAVSPNGRYIALGTADGSILVYIAWNLKLLREIPEVHNIFVTGLAFLPETKTIYDDLKLDVALLSVSVDNTCHLTTVARRSEYSFSFLLFAFVSLICLLFFIMAHYDINL
ncbi:prolactin regulatory element-binding protein-like [Rhopilema esculentum]|uniref:prolactin regulatory element-binding protein-like n=1 Tax=Rhopilema esculentum TaxID=499914 RepID=UPI0031D1433D